jgi:putrescine transport system ATP-binding protein
LDKKLRDETRFELVELQRRLGLTFIIVTHDQSEAMMVADRIGVMDRGKLMQVAPPAEIYERPNSRWVADFVGNINLFEGRLAEDRASVTSPGGRLRLAVKADAEPNAPIWIAVRPEKMQITREQPANGAENCLSGTVVEIGYLGDASIYKVRLADGQTVRATVANTGRRSEPVIAVKDTAWLSFSPEAAIVLTR